MAAESHEYRVIRRFPDEPDAIILPPTEDRRRAVSVYLMESNDGEVILEMRRVRAWERVGMPEDTMSTPRGRPLMDVLAEDTAPIHPADALVAMSPLPSLGSEVATDGG